MYKILNYDICIYYFQLFWNFLLPVEQEMTRRLGLSYIEFYPIYYSSDIRLILKKSVSDYKNSRGNFWTFQSLFFNWQT